MDKTFIAKERKISSIKDTGIQYIYGHDEKFVDFIIKNYLPRAGRILDLGGGGLRFVIPAALKGKTVTVVDLDEDSLDVLSIVDRINKNGKFFVKANKIKCKIKTVVDDIFNYLNEIIEHYSFISAFRIMHFFRPDKIDELFSLVSNKLNRHGLFVISGITIYDNQMLNKFNEFFSNSSKVYPDNNLYRKFNDTLKAKNIRKDQNLPSRIHFIDSNFINLKSEQYGFEVIECDIPSTRVVNGYILRKL